MIQAIKNFWFRRALKKQKEKALFEVRTDLEYLSMFKRVLIDFDEDNARKRMVELKAIENPTDEDQKELSSVLYTISQSKAVKNEWEQSKKLESDLVDYLSLL